VLPEKEKALARRGGTELRKGFLEKKSFAVGSTFKKSSVAEDICTGGDSVRDKKKRKRGGEGIFTHPRDYLCFTEPGGGKGRTHSVPNWCWKEGDSGNPNPPPQKKKNPPQTKKNPPRPQPHKTQPPPPPPPPKKRKKKFWVRKGEKTWAFGRGGGAFAEGLQVRRALRAKGSFRHKKRGGRGVPFAGKEGGVDTIPGKGGGEVPLSAVQRGFSPLC